MPNANIAFLIASVIAGAAGSGAGPQSSASRTVIQPWTGPAHQPRGDLAMRRTMLAAHATARAQVGVGPLAWNEDLALSAERHARDLALSGEMRHDGPFAVPRGVGENLWMGTRDAFSYPEMVAGWMDEARDYVARPAPAFSRTGTWKDVGHYTQMVWRGTTEVGCAVARGQADDVLVCRYAPAGNVLGQVAY